MKTNVLVIAALFNSAYAGISQEQKDVVAELKKKIQSGHLEDLA